MKKSISEATHWERFGIIALGCHEGLCRSVLPAMMARPRSSSSAGSANAVIALVLLAVLALVVAALPPVRDEAHWQWALRQNRTADYASYLRAWPVGRHAIAARDRYDQASWSDVTATGSLTAYEGYVAEHAHGSYIGEARDSIEALHWRDAVTAHTILSYQRYSAVYASGRYLREAEARERALRDDDGPYEAAQRIGNHRAYEDFMRDFPGHRRAAEARAALQDMNGRDVFDLLSEGKIEVRTQGSGIEVVSLEVRRRVPHPVAARIPVGTFFVSRNPSSQNMVATEEKTVVLSDSAWTFVTLSAACANRLREIPGDEDRFGIQRSAASAELKKLMPVLRGADVTSAVHQAAVWIVTDDADYEDLGVLVSRPAFMPFGGSRVINEHEAALAMRLCGQAGIDITRKAIWKDWNTILSGLENEELKKWLRQRARRSS